MGFQNSWRHYAKRFFSLILAFHAGLFAQSDRGRIPGRLLDASGRKLGGEYPERINRDRLQRYFGKQLQKPGLNVTVESAA